MVPIIFMTNSRHLKEFMKSWYLLYCKPRNEVRAQENLSLQQIDSYLPMYVQQITKAGKTSVKHSPLFPNYLFIYFDPQETSVSRIHSTRGVSRIIGCKEQMTSIDDSIIHSIRMQEYRLLNELKLDIPSHITSESVDFMVGDRVKFIDGPFAELEGIFTENSSDKRCQILFTFLGQEKRMSIPKSSIKPVE